ncbi:hypothetical protein F4X73_15055 [Candidatus Poribacteria bacterium]|nr:hypothetical protein [Candidatus Poribacteria bacterium]MYB66007.1 hypothetical protein [Candidatus Poribacteria bacterium]MYF56078.1 hypothetical protein [Candidatus Poribacteria bacterium]
MKLTKSKIIEIANLRQKGRQWSDIAKEVGVNRTTMWRWMRAGEKATSGMHYVFFRAIRSAERISFYGRLHDIRMRDMTDKRGIRRTKVTLIWKSRRSPFGWF